MSGTHPAAGVFSVAAVELLHNIPAFNNLAEGSKGGLGIIDSRVVAEVYVNLRGARLRAGVGKGDVAGRDGSQGRRSRSMVDRNFEGLTEARETARTVRAAQVHIKNQNYSRESDSYF
jgi:hypothetical protein